jgi:hypothetical protein
MWARRGRALLTLNQLAVLGVTAFNAKTAKMR